MDSEQGELAGSKEWSVGFSLDVGQLTALDQVGVRRTQLSAPPKGGIGPTTAFRKPESQPDPHDRMTGEHGQLTASRERLSDHH